MIKPSLNPSYNITDYEDPEAPKRTPQRQNKMGGDQSKCHIYSGGLITEVSYLHHIGGGCGVRDGSRACIRMTILHVSGVYLCNDMCSQLRCERINIH
jgi:hypothetical protein